MCVLARSSRLVARSRLFRRLITKLKQMFLYNVTIGIDRDVEQEWLQWMRSRYIPAVLNTGTFVDSKMYKVLHNEDDDTVSYSVQFFAEDILQVSEYLEKHERALGAELMQTFQNKHVAFRTLLEEV